MQAKTKIFLYIFFVFITASKPPAAFAQNSHSIFQQKKIRPEDYLARACSAVRDKKMAQISKQYEFMLGAIRNGSCDKAPAAEDVKAIVDSLRPYVKKLARQTTFYHWGNRGTTSYYYDFNFTDNKLHKKDFNLRPGIDESIILKTQNAAPGQEFFGPVPLRPTLLRNGKKIDVAEEYFRSLSGLYFKTGEQFHYWNNGEGLYGATNPIQSSSYGGGKSGFLLEIDVPEGETYLDARAFSSNVSLVLPKTESTDAAWKNIFRQVGLCNLHGEKENEGLQRAASDVLRSYQHLKFMLSNPYGKKVLKEVFSQLGIGFVIAIWGSSLYPECAIGDKSDSGTDVVFSDPNLAPRLNFRILVPNLENSPEPEKREAYAHTLALMSLTSPEISRDYNEVQAYFQGKWLSALGSKNSATERPADMPSASPAYAPPIPNATSPKNFFGCSDDPNYASERIGWNK